MVWDAKLKRKWDNQAAIDYAISQVSPDVFEKAVQEGRRKAALEIAGRLKMEGLSTSKIVQFTKLSIEEIEKL